MLGAVGRLSPGVTLLLTPQGKGPAPSYFLMSVWDPWGPAILVHLLAVSWSVC